MSGLHKLSELDKYFTPEDWERIAELEVEMDATMPPDESLRPDAVAYDAGAGGRASVRIRGGVAD